MRLHLGTLLLPLAPAGLRAWWAIISAKNFNGTMTKHT